MYTHSGFLRILVFAFIIISGSLQTARAQSCATPTNYSLDNITVSEFELSWDAVVDAIEYEIRYFTDSIQEVSYTTTSTSINIPIDAGGAHSLSLKAVCATGSSTPSNIITGTCDIIYNVICRPGGDKGKDVSLLYKVLKINVKYSKECFCDYVVKQQIKGNMINVGGVDWFFANCDDIKCPNPPYNTTD